MKPVHTSVSLPKSGFLLLAGLSWFWGLNWPTMKIVLGELSVWWFRVACLIVGGCALLLLSAASGNRVVFRRHELRLLIACALFNVFGWHLLSAYGVSIMPAGRASIIAFTMPLWAAIFSSFLLSERVTPSIVGGLILGLLGLTVLIGPDLIVFGQAPLGAVFMLGAALSWGLGTVLFKSGAWTTSIAVLAAWQLLLSAVPMTIGAALLEPVPDVAALSTPVILAIIYIFAFPMTFCQWAYFKVVRLFPATAAAIGTLMVPVIGVYSSSILLSEQVGWREFTALVLICASLLCVLLIPAWLRSRVHVRAG